MFFILISMPLSTNVSAKMMNIGLKLFMQNDLYVVWKRKCCIFEHYEKNKSKFEMFVLYSL